ncbi:E3 ubiquitin-protein ligase LRSAM1 [Acropora cervicornis]|uniref:E3 ubiquitin-protein ligase LRSAM1 n=1 Tax=Acropora cervicornis TaxID=6130 RepID=A0AAD9VAE3_ACRCE|nr:E3 ubiquitin-protein ligase LRSAM1 [Acropora cervicornis]
MHSSPAREMPLFKQKKVSKDESKRRVEKCLVVAKESPEPAFDLSKCGATEVPKGVYSLCKVLQKEALLMFDNALTNLKGGGSLKDLSALRVLDLHDNFITTLPADIDQLKALQVLNVQNNKLKSLPPSIGNLPSLQTLNLQDNDLHALPPEIGNSKSLRTLNISGNSNLQGVPPNLAHVRTIETIVLDTDRITFPPKDVSSEGTASIMKYLCKVAGIEYVPPSKHLLNVLDPVGNESSSSKHCGPTSVDDLIANTLSLHEAEKEKRRQQLLELERQIHETEQEQQALAALANKQRIDLVDKIRIAEAEMDDLTMHQQQQQDLERQKLVSAMAADEQLANDTVAMILQVNERAQKTEIILDELEQERMKTDQLVKITQEETERLKKEEVLASMAKLLESQESQGRLIREYERSREKAASQAMNESWEADMRLERAQMEAIQALQLQTDAKHCRITNQISMLQEELSKLTLTELDKRDERQDVERTVLESKREAVTRLLVQLVSEQQKREDELMKRLVEMEHKREADVEDYWLIQYQRLLEKKPNSLLEKQCDSPLLEVLAEAEAQDCASHFARHRITWEMLKTMTDEELKEIGIHQLGVRKAILRVVQERLQFEVKAKEKEQEIENPESDVVLLNCGHVCCCFTCSSALTACPMCRNPVVHRVRIFIS